MSLRRAIVALRRSLRVEGCSRRATVGGRGQPGAEGRPLVGRKTRSGVRSHRAAQGVEGVPVMDLTSRPPLASIVSRIGAVLLDGLIPMLVCIPAGLLGL